MTSPPPLCAAIGRIGTGLAALATLAAAGLAPVAGAKTVGVPATFQFSGAALADSCELT